MAEKTSITYIGNKAKKKDTITGSRLVFPRLKPVAIDSDIAEQLLEYPEVWVLSEEAEDIVEKQKKIAAEIEKEKAAKAAAEKLAQESENMEVTIDGGTIDLARYSSTQLQTFVEAHDLVIAVAKKPVGPYREAIREAVRNANTPSE